MKHRLELQLQPGRQSFARVVARLHALGLEVVAVNLAVGAARISVVGNSSDERIRTAMDRLVEVSKVRCWPEVTVTSTKSVVNRQLLAESPVPLPALQLRERSVAS